MTGLDLGAEIARAIGMDNYRELFATRYGEAAHQQWSCADGWIVGYTTERIQHARHEPYNGKFAAFAYKPIGKGARTGKASEFKMTYFRAFTKRKTARARAEALYWKHKKD
jgi:hypothetical protein